MNRMPDIWEMAEQYFCQPIEYMCLTRFSLIWRSTLGVTSRVQDNGRVDPAIDILKTQVVIPSQYIKMSSNITYSSVVLSNLSLNGPSCAAYQEYLVVVCHVASANPATVLLPDWCTGRGMKIPLYICVAGQLLSGRLQLSTYWPSRLLLWTMTEKQLCGQAFTFDLCVLAHHHLIHMQNIPCQKVIDNFKKHHSQSMT